MSKYIRVFVSSTFIDFTEERDVLNKEVFPELEEYCKKEGFVFQAVDLRWGITQEVSMEQETIHTCLEEVERCRNLSPKPNFFLMLGNRYGWEPLPPSISQDIAEAIFVQLRIMPRDRDHSVLAPCDLFNEWYILDENHDPPHYILRKKEKDDDFNRDSKFLLTMLRHAVKESTLDKAQKDSFFLSATAYEIVEGLKGVGSSCPVPKNSPIIYYFREVDGIDKHVDIDKEKKDALDNWKQELAGTYPEFNFTIKLGKNIIDQDYLEEFKNESLKVFKRIIDFRIIEENAKIEGLSPITIEKNIHSEFAVHRRENFCGREKDKDEFFKYLPLFKSGSSTAVAENKACIVYGEGGVGKSAFIAECLKDILQKIDAIDSSNPEKQFCVFRFVGASASSSSAYALVNSICLEILDIIKDDLDALSDDNPMKKPKKPETYPELCAFFENLLANIPTYKKVIIVVDAVDQLQSEAAENSLRWLPSKLPANVFFVVSTIVKSSAEDYLERVKTALAHNPVELQLENIDKKSLEQALDGLLKSVSRTLQPNQRSLLLEHCTESGLGLYLKMAFQLLKKWKSFEQKETLPTGITELIHHIYNELASEKQHGKIFTTHVLGYIALTYQGIAEDEILHILSNDVAVMEDFEKRFPKSPKINKLPFIIWARIRSDIDDYLKDVIMDDNIHLQFYHRILQDYVVEKFLSDGFKNNLHRKLCDFFDGQDIWLEQNKAKKPNVRKITALPHHLRACENYKALQDLVTNEEYLKAKVKSNQLEAYAQELLYVDDKLSVPTEKESFAKAIFFLVIEHNSREPNGAINLTDLHSFLIYSVNREFHKNFFRNAISIEHILGKVENIGHESAKKIYQDCTANRVNYFRRIGELDNGEKIALDELSKLISEDSKSYTSEYDKIMSINKELAEEEQNSINSDSFITSLKVETLLSTITDIPYYSRLLYEFGFIQFFQNKYEEAFHTILASSLTARINNNQAGELISRCVAYHIRSIGSLFTTNQTGYFGENSKILEKAIVKFQNLAKKEPENQMAKRWLNANTIEHRGIIAANTDDLDTLRDCVKKFTVSPWVKITDDKSNLYFMRARLAELEARLEKPQSEKLYEQACEAMEFHIKYKEGNIQNTLAKIEHKAQLYLSLGNSYSGLAKLLEENGKTELAEEKNKKAKESWQAAYDQKDEPGSKVWADKAAVLLKLK